MDWIREHPYLSGGLVLAIIVFFVIYNRSSSSASTVTSTGPSEALQAAQLSANVQQAQVSAAATGQANQLQASLNAQSTQIQGQIDIAAMQRDVALQSILSTQQSTNLQTVTAGDVAQTQTAAQVTEAGYGLQLGLAQNATVNAGQQLQAQVAQGATAAQVTIAGTQAQVAEDQSNNALAAQKVISSAALQQTQATTAASTAAARIAGTTSQAQIAASVEANQNAYQLGINTNLLALNEAGINADVQKTAIAATAGAQTHAIDVQGAVASQALDVTNNAYSDATAVALAQAQLQANEAPTINALLTQDKIHSGAQGLTQASIIADLLNQPGPSEVAASGSAAVGTVQAQQPSLFGQFLNGIGSGLSVGLFGGGVQVKQP